MRPVDTPPADSPQDIVAGVGTTPSGSPVGERVTDEPITDEPITGERVAGVEAAPGADAASKPCPSRPGIELRPATEADLLEAARLRARSWQESFAAFLPASSLAGFADSPWTRVLVDEWRELITGGGVVWLAFVDGEMVGLAQAERDDAPDAPAPVKLSKLYVLEQAKGTGVGARLFECAVGSGAAYLWVLEDNAHARAFYERRGFAADGTAQHLLDDLAHVREIRMVRHRGDLSRARHVQRSASPDALPAAGTPNGAAAVDAAPTCDGARAGGGAATDDSPAPVAADARTEAENSVETVGAVVEDGRRAQPS